jgi:hypothetical protein
MKHLLLFFFLVNLTFGGSKTTTGIKTKITAEDIDALYCETPSWVRSFNEESRSYTYTPNQPSLAALRATGLGNCVAFAKLGAWHALQEGWDCKFVRFTVPKSRGHMFLYATKDYLSWAVSSRSSSEVYSVENAILRMGYFGSLFLIESNITFTNLDSNNLSRTKMLSW